MRICHLLPEKGTLIWASLLLEFFLGMYDWLHIPIPIWVQVEGIAGTVRLRIQFIPEPPYVRNVSTIVLLFDRT